MRGQILPYQKEASEFIDLVIDENRSEKEKLEKALGNRYLQYLSSSPFIKASPQQLFFVLREVVRWGVIARRELLAGRDYVPPWEERQKLERILVGGSTEKEALSLFEPIQRAVAAKFLDVASSDKAIKQLQGEGPRQPDVKKTEEACCETAAHT